MHTALHSHLMLCGLVFSAPLTGAEDVDKPPQVEKSEASQDRLSLAEVTRAVIANNPSIKAVRAKWEMMKARVPQAAAWEDLFVGADLERFGTTRFGTYSDIEFMVMQEIPLSGKNKSRARIADAEALATLEEWRRSVLDAVFTSRTAYFKLANAHELLAVNQRNSELLAQFADISNAKYEAGTATQSDVLLAEAEQLKLRGQRADLLRDISEAQTQVNVLMNREPSSRLGQPTLTLTPFEPAPARLQNLTLLNRPELQMAQKRIAAEQAKLQLAKRQWIPDPQIRVEARRFKGDGGLSEYDTGIFLRIPWGNRRKYTAGEQEARSGIEMAHREWEAAQQAALGMVRDQLKKIETLHHNYVLFRDRLMPLSKQGIEATRSGYESGKAGFLDLITAQRNLQEFEAISFQHLSDHQAALAELEAIVGADLRIFPSPVQTTSKGSK